MIGSNQRRRDLSARIRSDLAQRSMQGLWAQPLCLLLVFGTTNFLHRDPRVLWGGMAFMLLQVIVRWVVLKRMRRVSASGPQVLDLVHLCLVLTCTAFWGILAAWAIRRFGYYDLDTLVLLIYHASIGYAVVNLLVHNLTLIRIGLMLLFLPPSIAQIWFGPADHRWGPVLSFLVYLMYVCVQANKSTFIYRRQIEDNYDLTRMAHHDALTGLPNRLRISQWLEDATRNSAEPFAVCFVDLDEFKRINDGFSHRTGDLFLQQCADRLTLAAGPAAQVARVGGDEFLIVLRTPNPREEIGLVTRRIAEATLCPISVDGHLLPFSVSMGISLYPDDATDASGLLRAADHAMYSAKNAGRGQYAFFRSESGPLQESPFPASGERRHDSFIRDLAECAGGPSRFHGT